MYNLFYKRKRGENMEEKNVKKRSLSTFFLILAIIAIMVMGIFIYKLNNDKTAEIHKSTELQAKVNNLNGTVNDLQEKMNTISEIINSNTNAVETSTNNSDNNVAITENILEEGTYVAEKQIDPSDGEGIYKVKIEKNKFSIDLFYGGGYNGTYTIKDNTLICNADEEEISEGGDTTKASNAIFEFKILNNKKLEFIINKNMSSVYTLNKGFIYNKK